jgi:hypothetical protein
MSIVDTASQSVQSAAGNLQSVLKGGDFLNSLTLRGPAFLRPKTVVGIGGFVFDYAGEASITLQAEITDHYAEDNSVINDHYAVRPARVMLRGLVGELVASPPQGINGVLDFLQNRLTTVPALLGKYTPQALGKVQKALTQAQNTVNTIDQGLSRVKNIAAFFGKANPGNTKQTQAFAFLESMMLSRQIFLVETPYKFFDNMAIEALSFIQPEETKYASDISITMKQMRFADTKTAVTDKANFSGRAAAQRGSVVDNGQTKGATLLYNLGVKPFLPKG